MALIAVEQRGHVTIVALDRPAALNALNGALVNDLRAAFTTIEGRVVVLTGAGQAFSTGADLKARAQMNAEEWRADHEGLRAAFAAVRDCSAPVIAAIEGYALAGGFELALCCDLVVAARDAEFGLPEVTRGIMPGAGGTKALPALIGMARAKDLVFTGRRINAETAAKWGLVVRVCEPGRSLETAVELATEIASRSALAVQAAKRSLDGEDELLAYRSAVPSDDQREGIQAFLEKREPHF